MRDITNFWGEKRNGTYSRAGPSPRAPHTAQHTHGASIFSTLHPAALDLPRLSLRVRSEFAKARSDSATLSCAQKGVVEIHVSGDKVSAHKRRSSDVHGDVSGPARRVSVGQCNERRRADELDRAGRGVAFEGAPYRPDCESMQTQETGPHLRPPPWTNDPKRKPR